MPETKPLSAADLYAYLESIGAPGSSIDRLQSMPNNTTAQQGLAAMVSGVNPLQHRFLERASAFVASGGKPEAEPRKAWEPLPEGEKPKQRPPATGTSVNPPAQPTPTRAGEPR